MKFDISNENISENLMRQLSLLLSTPVGTVVLDRDFGIDMSFVDMPVNVAKTMAAVELARKIKKYVPELVLKELKEDYEEAENGEMTLKVVVKLADE